MAVSKRRHKVFTPKKRKALPPISFEIYDQTFEAYPEVQGSVILEFAAAMDGGDDDNGAASAALIVSFFDKVLKPESLKAFKKLTHDPETIVEVDELAEIVSWLLEEYTSRPLEVSSVSSENS
jgi:hypothetical protein